MSFLLLLLLLLIPQSLAYTFLDPYLCFQGRALYWLSVSTGVRINQYGMFFFNSPVLHSGDSYPCGRVVGGLCQSDNYTFFPCTATPRTFVDAASPPFERLWYDEAKCQKTPSYHSFDVMPCDLASRDTTILWADGVISINYDTDIPRWPRMAIGLIMIWLVINLGESVALLLDVNGSKPQNQVTSGLCLLLVVLVVSYTRVEIIYATSAERMVYWSVIAYIVLYSVYHFKNPNTINVIVGCMLLVTSRVYQSAETPYVPSFMFLIATRFVQKCLLRKDVRPDDNLYSVSRALFMLSDVAMFIMQYCVGFANTFEDTLQAPLYMIGLFFSAFCLGWSISSPSSAPTH